MASFPSPNPTEMAANLTKTNIYGLKKMIAKKEIMKTSWKRKSERVASARWRNKSPENIS